MTEQELDKKLQEFSPFQFEGSNEKLEFVKNILILNGKKSNTYNIIDSNAGLKIHIDGLFPFQQNVLVDFGEDEQCVIVNYSGEKLLEYPENLRHWAANKGFFVLRSLKSTNIKQ